MKDADHLFLPHVIHGPTGHDCDAMEAREESGLGCARLARLLEPGDKTVLR